MAEGKNLQLSSLNTTLLSVLGHSNHMPLVDESELRDI